VASGAPRFPCDGALAVAAPEARCRNVVSAARAAAVGSAANVERSGHFGARAVADPAAVRDNDSAIGRNDGLGRAAGKAVAHRYVVAAATQVDNYAAPDNCADSAADSSFVTASHNSVAVVIDSCAAQNNCALAGTGIAAGIEAGLASVVNGWVPDGKDAAENRCDDSAQGTAPPPKPAS
jgi:hypothetical protein